mmetsp:Transcript_23128/g.59084  ORF Transcript_23128/g.59084 Transcript_23128/m.59084 type:complete len:238 (+) Transcript_23128:548-1261(+)
MHKKYDLPAGFVTAQLSSTEPLKKGRGYSSSSSANGCTSLAALKTHVSESPLPNTSGNSAVQSSSSPLCLLTTRPLACVRVQPTKCCSACQHSHLSLPAHTSSLRHTIQGGGRPSYCAASTCNNEWTPVLTYIKAAARRQLGHYENLDSLPTDYQWAGPSPRPEGRTTNAAIFLVVIACRKKRTKYSFSVWTEMKGAEGCWALTTKVQQGPQPIHQARVNYRCSHLPLPPGTRMPLL